MEAKPWTENPPIAPLWSHTEAARWCASCYKQSRAGLVFLNIEMERGQRCNFKPSAEKRALGTDFVLEIEEEPAQGDISCSQSPSGMFPLL